MGVSSEKKFVMLLLIKAFWWNPHVCCSRWSRARKLGSCSFV